MRRFPNNWMLLGLGVLGLVALFAARAFTEVPSGLFYRWAGLIIGLAIGFNAFKFGRGYLRRRQGTA